MNHQEIVFKQQGQCLAYLESKSEPCCYSTFIPKTTNDRFSKSMTIFLHFYDGNRYHVGEKIRKEMIIKRALNKTDSKNAPILNENWRARLSLANESIQF